MQALIDSASFLAHGYCLLWKPWLVTLYAGSDLLIFLAYSLIPLALVRFLRARPDLRYRGLVALFAAFIMLCGITHLASIATLWFPAYPLHGLLKLITGVVSAVTAGVLFTLIPRLVAIPSPGQLTAAHARLEHEIAAHEATLARLREAQRELEAKVEARTAEFEEANARLSVVTRETVHRANNLLSVVGSLARQTARGAPDLTTFVDRFSERLRGLAHATTVAVANQDRMPMQIGAVVRSQLGPIVDAFSDRVTLRGEPMVLRAEAAQQLALALHELATNTVKYGALAGVRGTVALDWAVVNEASPALRLTWTEHGSASLPAAARNEGGGFGTVLLTQAVPASLKGSATVVPVPNGWRYRLEFPLSPWRATEPLAPAVPRLLTPRATA